MADADRRRAACRGDALGGVAGRETFECTFERELVHAGHRLDPQRITPVDRRGLRALPDPEVVEGEHREAPARHRFGEAVAAVVPLSEVLPQVVVAAREESAGQAGEDDARRILRATGRDDDVHRDLEATREGHRLRHVDSPGRARGPGRSTGSGLDRGGQRGSSGRFAGGHRGGCSWGHRSKFENTKGTLVNSASMPSTPRPRRIRASSPSPSPSRRRLPDRRTRRSSR